MGFSFKGLLESVNQGKKKKKGGRNEGRNIVLVKPAWTTDGDVHRAAEHQQNGATWNE